MFNKVFGGKAAEAAEPAPEPMAEPIADRGAALAEEEARLEALLASGDEAAIAPFVTSGGSTRIRQRAAGAIHDPTRLRELIRAMRGGRDDAAYRILAARRDALLQVERELAQRQAEVEAVAGALARHAQHVYEPLYEPTLAELERRWLAIAAHAPGELSMRATESLAACQAVVTTQRALAAEAAQRERAAREATEREREARSLAAAEEASAREQRAADEAAETARREAEQSHAQAAAAAEGEVARALVGLLRQAQAALARGSSARAARLRETLAAKLVDAPAAALPPWFARQLEQADEQLASLRDWNAYTAAPKRAELIERMRSLIGAEIAPEPLAQHIRKLQQEWRTLHRGAGDDDSADAKNFRELGHQAYEPCKAHFAAKAALRAENRAQRESILTRLTAFTAAQTESPNWRLVAQVLSEARREWQQWAPVDQNIAEQLQARLRAALDALSGPLEAEYARNLEARRSLIARAEALLALADVRAAIEGAKDLQRLWKEAGIVPRAKDHALWETFRGHCNAVFERSAQEHAALASALATHAARARELIEAVEAAAQLQGEALRAALPEIDARAAEMDGLDLPRASARELHQRFQRALERCRGAVQDDRARSAGRERSALFEAAAAIRAHVAARANGDCAERLAGLQSDVEAALAAIAQAPKVPRTALERLWAKSTASDGVHDPAANEVALRLLCVRAELAADRPTPAEDQERRRALQMQRLLASRTLGTGSEPDDLNALALEWFAVGPVAPGVEEALRVRFESCRGTSRARR